MVDLEPLVDAEEIDLVQTLIVQHAARDRQRATPQRLLDDWASLQRQLVKVMPRDYKRVLAEQAKREAARPRECRRRSWPADRQKSRTAVAVQACERVRPMGKPTGFIEIQRKKHPTRPVAERVHDWREVYLPYRRRPSCAAQGARCMDCGIPFCHQGCPLGNLIPDWNDLVYRDRWQAAIDRLHATNNFPEFTGSSARRRAKASCVLGINDDPVTIK